jgi:DNA topoisomerase I
MNHFIIVESPAKARTINKFLGAKYKIEASMGHIRDLPKKVMGIDTEHDFEPTYEIPDEKKAIVKKLNAAIHKYDDTMVWLASDEDREGESIAWHLVHALKLKKDQYKRIAFHEITKPAVLAALEHPRDLDINLIHAQQARRVLDRLVGYEISPVLWKIIGPGLSAGRVQSVAVRLIVDREREILAFKPEEYWNIGADLKAKHGELTVELAKINGEKAEVKNAKEADKILADLKKGHYIVADLIQKETTRQPANPFITSSLQQEASRKLGFSVLQTMVVAQQLYEGVEMGKEHTGLITYMRTDSYNLSAEFLKDVPKVIRKMYGNEYALETPRVFTKKMKGAQEAHEAIRPTDPSKTPASVKEHLEPAQYKLYKLIWERTIACQMPAAKLDSTTALVDTGNGYTLSAKGQVIKFPGFMKVYVEGTDHPDEALADKESILPPLTIGEKLALIKLNSEQKFTQPPARYTEAMLVKMMESKGIGRPSTYAPTISTIITRRYVEKKADKKLYPMEIGMIVNDFLVEHFPNIVDLDFTADMEEKLDKIAEGEEKWAPVIREFYTPFKKTVEEKKKTLKKGDAITEKTDEKCELCGKPMLVKLGRFGKFLSCSGYPDCKNKKPLLTEAEKEEESRLQKEFKDEKCPVCNVPMIIKKGRFGEFLACSNYPKHKYTRPLTHPLKVKCPKDGGDLVEKRTKKGKVFYGCSNYPKCDFATWSKPIDDPCVVCGGLQVQAKKNLIKCEKCGKETEVESKESE